MGFIESISSAFNNYFNFKGRSSKSAFWYFILFEVIYFFIAGILLGVVGANDETADLAISCSNLTNYDSRHSLNG